jgi:hypothetical protein
MNLSKGTIIKKTTISFEYDLRIWNTLYQNNQDKAARVAYLEIMKDILKTNSENESNSVCVISIPHDFDNIFCFDIPESKYEEVIKDGNIDLLYFVKSNIKNRSFEMMGGITKEDFISNVRIYRDQSGSKICGTKIYIDKSKLDVMKFYQKFDCHFKLFIDTYSGSDIRELISKLTKEECKGIFALIQRRIELLLDANILYEYEKNGIKDRGQWIIYKNQIINNSISSKSSGKSGLDCCEYCASFYFLFYIFILNCDKRLQEWWINMEFQLLSLKLKYEYFTQKHILRIIENNQLIEKTSLKLARNIQYSNLNQIWNKMHSISDTEIPISWFYIHFLEAMNTLETGDIILESGNIYIAYDKLKYSIIPEIVKEKYAKLIENTKYEMWDHDTIKIEHELQYLKTKIENSLFPKNQYNGFTTIPPIEEAHIHFPLCQFIFFKNLNNGELHNLQRRGFIGFLKDCGYEKRDIENYIMKLMDSKDKSKKKGARKAELNSWIRTSNNNKNKKGPNGRLCESLIKEDLNNNSNKTHALSCPFKYYGNELLSESLKEYGITDPQIIEKATQLSSKDPISACNVILSYKNQKIENIHHAPHFYFFKSIRRHISIEYEK